MINTYIKQLVNYGLANNLIKEEDVVYTTNMLLMTLKLDDYEDPGEVSAIDTPEKLEETLKGNLDYAFEHGLIEEDSVVLRDLFDTKIMNLLVESPSRIISEFRRQYEISP